MSEHLLEAIFLFIAVITSSARGIWWWELRHAELLGQLDYETQSSGGDPRYGEILGHSEVEDGEVVGCENHPRGNVRTEFLNLASNVAKRSVAGPPSHEHDGDHVSGGPQGVGAYGIGGVTNDVLAQAADHGTNFLEDLCGRRFEEFVLLGVHVGVDCCGLGLGGTGIRVNPGEQTATQLLLGQRSVGSMVWCIVIVSSRCSFFWRKKVMVPQSAR